MSPLKVSKLMWSETPAELWGCRHSSPICFLWFAPREQVLSWQSQRNILTAGGTRIGVEETCKGKENRAMIRVCACVCPVIMVCERRKHTVPVFASGVPGSQPASVIGDIHTHMHTHTGYLASKREKHAASDTCAHRQADFLHFPSYWAATCNTVPHTHMDTHTHTHARTHTHTIFSGTKA